MADHPLNDVIGQQLSSVEFVQDYLQLHFDGPTLTVYTHPSVTVEDMTYPMESLVFRNVLCDRIGILVEGVRISPQDAIYLHFADRAVIRIPLHEEGFDGPEAAMFVNPLTRQWDVWDQENR